MTRMTRQEFIEEINNDIWNLHEFCCDNGYDYYFDDLYSSESRDDYINDEMVDKCRDLNWEEMYSWLNDFTPSGEYEWWRIDGWGDWAGVDDDYVEMLINNLANDLESDGYFDEEEEEEEDKEDDIVEDVDFGSFFSECHTESDRFISRATDDEEEEIDDLLAI